MRILTWLIALALLLPSTEARGQIEAPDLLRCVIVIIHEVLPDKIWIIAPEYMAGPTVPGDYVAVGFGMPSGAAILQETVGVEVVHAGTNDPVDELGPVVANATVTAHLMTADPTRDWMGFLAPVLAPLPVAVPVDLHVEVDVAAITSIAQLSQEAMDAGFGSGGADMMGNPVVPPFDLRNPTDVTVIDERTSVPAVIGVLSLSPPSPNPASTHVVGRLSVVPDRAYHLAVYDLRGRRVRQWSGLGPQIGEAAWTWNLREPDGTPVAAGTYLLQLQQGGTSVTRTMVRVR